MARRFRQTGVIDGSLNELAVSADGSAMSVSVATGDAFVEGFFYRNDAAKAMTISTAHATLGRIDTIVVRLDRVANSAALAVVTGTAAASPVAATLSQTDSLYELPLANVQVDAAVGVITVGKVTDRRTITSTFDSAAYLSKTGKAADSDKLDGIDSAGFATAAQGVKNAGARSFTDNLSAYPAGLSRATAAASTGWPGTFLLILTDASADGWQDIVDVVTGERWWRKFQAGVGWSALRPFSSATASGSYAGDGAASRTIVLPFTPGLVVVASNTRYALSPPGNDFPVGLYASAVGAAAVATETNASSLPLPVANGFTIPAALNASGTTFYYYAMRG